MLLTTLLQLQTPVCVRGQDLCEFSHGESNSIVFSSCNHNSSICTAAPCRIRPFDGNVRTSSICTFCRSGCKRRACFYPDHDDDDNAGLQSNRSVRVRITIRSYKRRIIGMKNLLFEDFIAKIERSYGKLLQY